MRLSTRDMILVGAFAGLAAASAILVRFGGDAIVPFSPLPFVAMAAGLMLGSTRGALAMGVYVLLGIVGVPIFAKAPFGGPQYVLQPTFGFLLGFVAGAFVAGRAVELVRWRGPIIYVAGGGAALVAMYALGLPYLWAVFNYVMAPEVLDKIGMARPVSAVTVIQIGAAPFILFDLVKMLLAALLARLVRERITVAVPGAP